MPSLFSKIACGITAALCLSGQVVQAGSTARILGERPDDRPGRPGHGTHVENPLHWAELPRVDCIEKPEEALEKIFAVVYDQDARVPRPHCIAANLFFQAAVTIKNPGDATTGSGGGYPKSFRRSWILNYWAAQELWQVAHEYQDEPWDLYKAKISAALQTIVGFPVQETLQDVVGVPISVAGFALPVAPSNDDGYSLPFLKVSDEGSEPIQPETPVQPPIVTDASILPEDPSFAFWFRWLEQTYPALGADADADINPGLEKPMASPVIPFETQKKIELAYTNVGSLGRRARSVVDVYTELTGCRVKPGDSGDFKNGLGFSGYLDPEDPKNPDAGGYQEQFDNFERILHDRGCYPGVFKAFEASGLYGAYGATFKFPVTGQEKIPSADLCFETYFQKVPPKERDAAGVRFLLDWCQDANALNTGAGVTFNLAANPLVCKPKDRQTVEERYGPPEFTIDGCSGGVEQDASPEKALNNVGCATWEKLKVAKRPDQSDGEGPYFYVPAVTLTAAQLRDPAYQFLTRGYCR